MKKLNILLVPILLFGDVRFVLSEEITQVKDKHQATEMIQGNPIYEKEKNNEEKIVTNEARNDLKSSVDAEENLAFGTFVTSLWSVDSADVLHIGPGTFAAGQGPSTWHRLRGNITKIIFEGSVKANDNSSGLFQYL